MSRFPANDYRLMNGAPDVEVQAQISPRFSDPTFKRKSFVVTAQIEMSINSKPR